MSSSSQNSFPTEENPEVTLSRASPSTQALSRVHNSILDLQKLKTNLDHAGLTHVGVTQGTKTIMVEVNPSSRYTGEMIDRLIGSLEERRVELLRTAKNELTASIIIVNRISDALG